MRKQYDFSDAVKGKFYIPKDRAEFPIYLDKKNKEFYLKRAKDLGVNPTTLINNLLKKDKELVEQLE